MPETHAAAVIRARLHSYSRHRKLSARLQELSTLAHDEDLASWRHKR